MRKEEDSFFKPIYAELGGMFGAFVEKCVNVITDAFTESCSDVDVPSIEP